MTNGQQSGNGVVIKRLLNVIVKRQLRVESDARSNRQMLVDQGEKINHITTVLDGDEELGLVGLRTRIRELEEFKKINEENSKRIKWILIGLGLTGATNISAIIALLSNIFKAP